MATKKINETELNYNFSTVDSLFNFIFNKYGSDIVSDNNRFLSLLSDYAPNMRNERRLIKIATEASVYKTILQIDINDSEEIKICIDKMCMKLQNEYFLDEFWSKKVIEWFVDSLNQIKNNDNNLNISNDTKNISIDNGNNKYNSQKLKMLQNNIKILVSICILLCIIIISLTFFTKKTSLPNMSIITTESQDSKIKDVDKINNESESEKQDTTTKDKTNSEIYESTKEIDKEYSNNIDISKNNSNNNISDVLTNDNKEPINNTDINKNNLNNNTYDTFKNNEETTIKVDSKENNLKNTDNKTNEKTQVTESTTVVTETVSYEKLNVQLNGQTYSFNVGDTFTIKKSVTMSNMYSVQGGKFSLYYNTDKLEVMCYNGTYAISDLEIGYDGLMIGNKGVSTAFAFSKYSSKNILTNSKDNFATFVFKVLEPGDVSITEKFDIGVFSKDNPTSILPLYVNGDKKSDNISDIIASKTILN